MKYILISGVHGVGKTTLLKKIEAELPIVSYTISDLIRSTGVQFVDSEKRTKKIKQNQDIWKLILNGLNVNEANYLILDGHFSLLNASNEIVGLPQSTFSDTDVNAIILKLDEPETIQRRLQNRDNKSWDLRFINQFQRVEKELAIQYAKDFKIPIFVYKEDSQLEDVIRFIIDRW